jgi:hypothetical protein
VNHLRATLAFPFRLVVLPNLHVSHFARYRVVSQTKQVVGFELRCLDMRNFRRRWEDTRASNPRLRLEVRQTRVGPKALDDDNCTGAFKPVRDAVSEFFGIDDGRRDAWVWLPCQQEIGLYAVRLEFRVVEVADELALPLAKKKRSSSKMKPTPNVRRPR